MCPEARGDGWDMLCARRPVVMVGTLNNIRNSPGGLGHYEGSYVDVN